jgi:hypothetical protein
MPSSAIATRILRAKQGHETLPVKVLSIAASCAKSGEDGSAPNVIARTAARRTLHHVHRVLQGGLPRISHGRRVVSLCNAQRPRHPLFKIILHRGLLQ